MPRPLRIQYEGAIYHVMSRGDRRQLIFGDDADRLAFLDLLARACAKTGWQVHACVLMGNHFHLVLETPQPNLGAGMKWLLGVYTQAFNRRHAYWGHLFGGRYKAQPVDDRDASYLRAVCAYVHLNPARARLIAPGDPLETYRWSSYPAYLRPARRPEWLRCDRLLGEHGIARDDAAGRREFARDLKKLRGGPMDDDGGIVKHIRRGWRIGAEDFADRLSQRLARRGKKTERAEARRETDERLAERIVRAGLAARGWDAAQLGRGGKADPVKVELARQVRAQTPMTLAWIAQRLGMGSASYLAALLAKQAKSAGPSCRPTPPPPRARKKISVKRWN